MADLRVLWLCPFLLPTIPPLNLPYGLEFRQCHRRDEVDELLKGLESPRFDAVVVDTSPAQGHGYDPVDMVARVAVKCEDPPRYLLAVVKQGIDPDPLDSQIAFAVEMRGLWSDGKPMLIIEEAVLYHLEQRPSDIERSKRLKESSIGQVRRWADIADRASKLVMSELPVETRPVSTLTKEFVAGMCAKSRRSAVTYFSQAQRDLLFELALHRLSVKALSKKLAYKPDYIRRLQKQIAEELYPYVPQASEPSGRPDHAEFCDALVESYGPWLRSRHERISRTR